VLAGQLDRPVRCVRWNSAAGKCASEPPKKKNAQNDHEHKFRPVVAKQKGERRAFAAARRRNAAYSSEVIQGNERGPSNNTLQANKRKKRNGSEKRATRY